MVRCKRIVPAGVEDHQPKLLCRFDRQQHAVERQRFIVNVGVALEFGVDRNQIIATVHLDAVTGVIDHGNVGVARSVGEIAQHAAGLCRRKIMAGIDHVKPGVLQGRRDGGAIVDRVGKPRHVLIGRIADHQRHALVRKGRLAYQQQRGGKEKPAKS